ncbi:class I SAM-dependent methyltransferase [Magnetospirillum sp. 15-1]|uniref:class I SAM-dependent methyltransferase n=1 Tax=Magnetospirillum sp. 15-1 TaxID=1979370 RepID=UPI00148231F3|nr:class I SAM-dependent methyltransferase [Magnetospirillum sp. 15-1]
MSNPSSPIPHYEGRDLEILADAPRYQSWIVDQFRPYLGGHVVEYGAGFGSISILLAPNCRRLDLVEPSEPLIPPLTRRVASLEHVSVLRSSLESHVAELADNSLDGVVLVNVLEHVEDDIAALRQLARVIKPGGHLMLYVPALSWLMSELDRMHGHHRRYSRQDLRSRVSAAGLRVLRDGYMDLVGVVPWWLINVVGGSTAFSPRMIKLYDRLFVPATKIIERLVGAPIGKNLILVAHKPLAPSES